MAEIRNFSRGLTHGLKLAEIRNFSRELTQELTQGFRRFISAYSFSTAFPQLFRSFSTAFPQLFHSFSTALGYPLDIPWGTSIPRLFHVYSNFQLDLEDLEF